MRKKNKYIRLVNNMTAHTVVSCRGTLLIILAGDCVRR